MKRGRRIAAFCRLLSLILIVTAVRTWLKLLFCAVEAPRLNTTSSFITSSLFQATKMERDNKSNKTLIQNNYNNNLSVRKEVKRTIPLPPGVTPRAFQSANTTSWCTGGFYFMKPMKTGGSTAVGIHVRIMRNVARRLGVSECQGQWQHAWAYDMLKNRKHRNESFTWTLLRDPTRRVTSQFFHFEVTRQGTPPTDESFQKYLKEEYHQRDALYQYYLRVLSVTRPKKRFFGEEIPSQVQKTLNEYDFIGITERMDESAVALMMLLNLKMADIMFLDAKVSGGYDDLGYNGVCYLIKPSFISEGMSEFFSASWWKRVIHADEILYEAANASLDMTIDKLGRDKFNEKLALFRKTQNVARERCLSKEVFPCTSKGKRNSQSSCLWNDSGCGSDCLDEIATEHHLS